jgi:hypothetical protein
MHQQPISQELFFSLSAMPSAVTKLVNLFSSGDLNWKPLSWDGIPGEKFSAIEQLCHLRDIEIDGYHRRIFSILNDQHPDLQSIDGYTLSIERNYKDADLAEVISQFQAAREKTIAMISVIEPAGWNRTGFFNGYGNVTLKSLIHFLCSHDFEHLSSMRWLLGKLEGEKLR